MLPRHESRRGRDAFEAELPWEDGDREEREEDEEQPEQAQGRRQRAAGFHEAKPSIL